MNAQAETNESGVLDTIKLLIAAAALVGGLYAYYYYETTVAQALRVLMVLGGAAAGIGIAMMSTQGQRLWHFIQGSRVKIRKVVWPTRQETVQTTLIVVAFVLLVALVLWGLDSFLGWLVSPLAWSLALLPWGWLLALHLGRRRARLPRAPCGKRVRPGQPARHRRSSCRCWEAWIRDTTPCR